MEWSLSFIGNCIHIHDLCLVAAHALERMMSPVGPSPNPNVPSEYCSTIPPLQQARAAGTLNSPPPTVMVPVSVLKHPNHDGMLSFKYRTQPHHNHRSFFPLLVPLHKLVLSFVFRLPPWTEARLVRWRHPSQWRGGRHDKAVGDEPQGLPGVQRRHLGPNHGKGLAFRQGTFCILLDLVCLCLSLHPCQLLFQLFCFLFSSSLNITKYCAQKKREW